VLLVKLRDAPPTDAMEEEGGVVISYGADHLPVSVEFVHVSQYGLGRSQFPSVTVTGLAVQDEEES